VERGAVTAGRTDYHPVKFLDGLDGYSHMVLLYDRQEYADLVIARYFLNGLNKGGSCIYFTSDDQEPVEERLSAAGIDVERYVRAGQLRVYRPKPAPKGIKDPLSILRAIRREATKGMKPPFRFAGRTIMDTESKEGMLAGMAVEKTGQEHFAEFENSQLCFYDVRKIEPSRRVEWITGLLKNHHQVIYASRPDKAVAFETSLLESDE
jgi:hypothetical protein